MHLEMLKLAKDELESLNFKVLGAYISPSHEYYVSRKLQKDYIYTELRLEMCKLAIEESGYSNFIQVDPWEATQPWFFDFPDVVSRMDTFVKKTWPKEKISNLILCSNNL
jgi:nicotinic acid mononucleotide adenylyltransferase